MDEELIAAASAGNVQKLRDLIDRGANIEAKDKVRERLCGELLAGATNLTGLCAAWIHAAPSCSW
jgi:hypothetical protein